MIVLARQVVTGEVDLEALRDEPDAHALAMLLGLGGVGRWSAEYALLRGLGRHHVLPGDDVGARNSLRRRFGLDPRSGYDAVADLARAWWPYGGLVYFHLVFDTLVTAGHLAASRSEFATSPTGPSRPEVGVMTTDASLASVARRASLRRLVEFTARVDSR